MQVFYGNSFVKSTRTYKNIKGQVHQNIAKRTQKAYAWAIKPYGADYVYVFDKSHFGKKGIVSEVIVVEERNGKALNMLSTLMDDLKEKSLSSPEAGKLFQKVADCFEDLKLSSYNNVSRKPKHGYSLN